MPMAKKYFADYMNDLVFALDEQWNGHARQVVDIDNVRVKMRISKVVRYYRLRLQII